MPTRLVTAALITTLAMVLLFAHPGSAEMLYTPEGTRVIIRELRRSSSTAQSLEG
jgi:hypothetical protein